MDNFFFFFFVNFNDSQLNFHYIAGWCLFVIFLSLLEKVEFLWSFQIYDKSLNYPQCLTFTGAELTESKFTSRLHPLLARLVAHHRHLQASTQLTVKWCVASYFPKLLCIIAGQLYNTMVFLFYFADCSLSSTRCAEQGYWSTMYWSHNLVSDGDGSNYGEADRKDHHPLCQNHSVCLSCTSHVRISLQ